MGRSRAAELYPSVAKHQGEEVKKVTFIGGEPFQGDTLQTLIDTEPTHCDLIGLPICLPILGRNHLHRLNVDVVRRDITRLIAFYRREGYFGTRITPRAGAPGEISFLIQPGDPITLDSLTVVGAESVFNADSLAVHLPIHVGEIFNVGKYEASADQVLREMQARGYAYAEVLRNYSVDTLNNKAVASIEAIPGVQARVDSIVVVGADHLGVAAARRQLTINRGDLLRLDELVESQRNLYSLDIVQLASVAIAPDSMQKTVTDSSTTTLLVSIAEAPVNQAEAGVGFGTVECFRTDGRWTNRSFTGGARKIDVTASISKIGLGGFTDAGLNTSLCQAFRDDSTHALDYRVATEFTQPYFFSARNHLLLNLYSERISEPSVYQRQATGGQLTISRRLEHRRILSVTGEVVRAKTLADAILFCTAFQACIPQEIERLTQPRFRNTLSVSLVDDHTDQPLDPTRGHVLRTTTNWATPWLSSSVTYTRWTGDASMYRLLKPGWVLATSLRLGTFFGSASTDPRRSTREFLPPEERFFAGGATTVRGFARNELGRGAYVTDTTHAITFVPLGGTSMVLANAELRYPSPILRKQMRLAAFVDGGTVATGQLWQIDADEWRFTPGVGLRITTPVGPARVDVAYNPYKPISGVLFFLDKDKDEITTRSDAFTPDRPNFFGRMRVHVAIGQAF
jgi:outer membrane protein assembly factor BamA